MKMKLFNDIIRSKKLLSYHANKYVWVIWIQLLVFALVTIYQSLVLPFILTKIFEAVSSGSWSYILQICLFDASLITIFFVLCYVNNVYMDLYSFRISFSINKSLCRGLFQLPYDRISEKHDNADILTRIENGSGAIDGTFIFVTLIAANIASLCGLLLLSGSTSVFLILFVVITIVVTLLKTKWESKAKKGYEMLRQQLKSENETIVSQISSLPAFINMNDVWGMERKNYQSKREALWKNEWKAERLSIFLAAGIEVFTSILRGSLGMVFYPLRVAGLAGDAVIAASLSIYDSLRGSVSGFSFPFTLLAENSVKIDRLEEVAIDISNRCDPVPVLKKSNPAKVAAITVNNLYYSVNGGLPILSDIALSIEKGEKVALIGCNGSGKSTLLKCLCGVNTPDSGEINIDGSNDVYSRSAHDNDFYRAKMGYTPSVTYLYSSTVEENILMNTDDDEDDNVVLAMRQAGIAEDEAILESSALELSGGQKQRVNIARTLAHKVPLIIADEPFSGIQVAVGDRILHNIFNSAETVVIVTHSPDQLAFFDRIILIENGHIAVQGKLEMLQGRAEFIKWCGEAANL